MMDTILTKQEVSQFLEEYHAKQSFRALCTWKRNLLNEIKKWKMRGFESREAYIAAENERMLPWEKESLAKLTGTSDLRVIIGVVDEL